MAALGVAFVVASCGGGSASNSNESKINAAKASEANAAKIHAKLEQSLQLHSYAGVDDAFTLPPGSPDIHLGEAGRECSIDHIEVGSDAAQRYSANASTLVSPDNKAVVRVGRFLGTPESDCLEAVRNVLGW